MLAIQNSPQRKMTLCEIYQWIIENFIYYRQCSSSSWKNSIRHNLSLNKCFKKMPRTRDDPGKGCYWTIDQTNFDELCHPSAIVSRFATSGRTLLQRRRFRYPLSNASFRAAGFYKTKAFDASKMPCKVESSATVCINPVFLPVLDNLKLVNNDKRVVANYSDISESLGVFKIPALPAHSTFLMPDCNSNNAQFNDCSISNVKPNCVSDIDSLSNTVSLELGSSCSEIFRYLFDKSINMSSSFSNAIDSMNDCDSSLAESSNLNCIAEIELIAPSNRQMNNQLMPCILDSCADVPNCANPIELNCDRLKNNDEEDEFDNFPWDQIT